MYALATYAHTTDLGAKILIFYEINKYFCNSKLFLSIFPQICVLFAASGHLQGNGFGISGQRISACVECELLG